MSPTPTPDITAVHDDVIRWRRDFHQHPELSNRETRTAGIVSEHLQSLGLEVTTGVAHTGVVGILRGGDHGSVVALRADMDALPVVEQVDLPFASKERTIYEGDEVGVMHACGHDAHTAILMGVATVLAGRKERLRGTVKFIFQPAEEGAPEGEEGGAELMVREGVLEDPRPSAIFGLHVTSRLPSGHLGTCPGPLLAAADQFTITVLGRQTHGGYPWKGIDPILIASQIVCALQTIPSRQLDLTRPPAVISPGQIHGGVRHNIIPETVEINGTIRTLDEEIRKSVLERIRRTATGIAAAAGAEAEVVFRESYPSTQNDPDLAERMIPLLERVAGEDLFHLLAPVYGSEDFAYYQKVVPGLFFYLGVRPPEVSADDAAPNHSPRFFVDENALLTGVEAMVALAEKALHPG
jgi:amidohydrolase